MKKYFFFVVLLILVSCRKGDVTNNSPVESAKKDIDYAAFFDKTLPAFEGKLNGTNFSWDMNRFHASNGHVNKNGGCDPNDPLIIPYFNLAFDGTGEIAAKLFVPRYDVNSTKELYQVFSVGKKKLGDFCNDFHLTFIRNNNFYQCNSSTPGNDIEILKIEESAGVYSKQFKVWLKINATLSSHSHNLILTDGLMVATFLGS